MVWERACLALAMLSAACAAPRPADSLGVSLIKDSVSVLPSPSDRIAIVIGVDSYRSPSINALHGAVKDARRLSEALVSYAGFRDDRVFLMTSDQAGDNEPTRANILSRLSNVSKFVGSQRDGLILFAFAGHGIERAGRSFLLPVDARLSSDVWLLEETAIKVDDIAARLADAKQAILVMDACRTVPAEADRGSAAALGAEFAKSVNDRLTNAKVNAFATIFATAPRQRAFETRSGDGFFSLAFVDALSGKAANERGDVTLGSLVRYLQSVVPERVQLEIGEEQRPFVHIEGYRADELVISRRDGEPSPKPAPPRETASTPSTPAGNDGYPPPPPIADGPYHAPPPGYSYPSYPSGYPPPPGYAPPSGYPPPPPLASSTDVSIVWRDGKVSINGFALPSSPTVLDLKAILGPADRVSDGINRIHTFDKLGIYVYEPHNGKVNSIAIALRRTNFDFVPAHAYKGRLEIQGMKIDARRRVADLKQLSGAHFQYGSVEIGGSGSTVLVSAPDDKSPFLDEVVLTFPE